MTIEYSASDDPHQWIETIAEQFSGPVIDNEVKLPPKIGDGFFRQYYPCEWLTVSYLRYRVNEALYVHRHGAPNCSLVPIVFYLAEAKQVIDNKTYNVGNLHHNGVFMPSPEIESRWIFPAETWQTNLTLTFNKEWLIREFGKSSQTYLCELLTNNKPFYIFESLKPPILEVIAKIEECAANEDSQSKFFVYEYAISLFNRFFIQLNQRKHPEVKSSLHPVDIDAVFKVRKIILENISAPPSLEILAYNAGMSVSKLQKCFKHVFGNNISKYALHEKMEVAKELLASGMYSVSDVGYRLGYSNLSHFARAFHNEYKINPNNYVSQCKLARL